MKILVLNLCKERLHYFEFVKPVEKILRSLKIEFETKFYKKFSDKDLKFDKIIICGTSLQDFEYFKKENLKLFEWLKIYKKPVLGICAGMQVLVKTLSKDSILTDDSEIGFNDVEFNNFLGLNGKIQVYELHQVSFMDAGSEFEVFAKSEKTIQAVKHKKFDYYGVFFHPEVLNSELIRNFCMLHKD